VSRVFSVAFGARYPRAIAIVLAIAAALRLGSVHFGLPALNDPDELMYELGALRMLRSHSLNPGWFGHPATTTIYVLAIIDALVFCVGYIANWFGSVRQFGEAVYADPTWIILPGRLAMVLFGVWAVWLTWRLASELVDERTALVAAALVAFNPIFITWSQIIRSDTMATCFMLACMRAALRVARGGGRRDEVKASAWFALAMATKWPFGLSALAVIGAIFLNTHSRPVISLRVVGRIGLFFAMGACLLFLISPYLILDYPTALRNLQGEAQLRHLGATGGTSLQNAQWYLCGPILNGIGLVGLIFAAIGLPILARNRETLAVVIPVLTVFFVVLCLQHLVWARWVLPLAPLLSISAAFAFRRIADAFQIVVPRATPVVLTIVTASMLVPLCIKAERDGKERLNDTRQRAATWARSHISSGSSVLVEHFAFDLLPQPWRFLYPLADAGCVDARNLLRDKVSYSFIDQARGSRANIDYGTVPVWRRDTCRTDWAIITQADRYHAERTYFPVEYAAYRGLFAQGRIVASFLPVEGQSGGPVVRVIRLRPVVRPQRSDTPLGSGMNNPL